MAPAVRKTALHPSVPPQKLSRPNGFKPVSISVGTNGNVTRLFVRDDLVEEVFARTTTGFASFPKTQTEEQYSPIAVVSSPSRSDEIRLSGLTATFPKIEMLPSNEILVVAMRSQRFADGSYELNGKVYDLSGALRREFLLGDGIQHVQSDPHGNIWVGYCDEGVYGNFGWQDAPFGAWGLSCFSESGYKLWDFHPPEGFDPISDCYALNATQKGVWAYYYTGFPFVHIDENRQVRCWKTESAGGRTFAVGKENVLLYGGYNNERTTCKLFNISDEAAELVADVSLVLPTEVELSKSTVIGRNAELHVFSGDVWYRFSIESLRC